ncbi:MAG: O-antigen ligase family protein [Candidatus Diapherotrites archaeon]|nr:O-antigen ligase family protein [Candidatus Diapherotrites archaeon]
MPAAVTHQEPGVSGLWWKFFLAGLCAVFFVSGVVRLPETVFLLALFCLVNLPVLARNPGIAFAVFFLSPMFALFPENFEHIINPVFVVLPVLALAVALSPVRKNDFFAKIFSAPAIFFALFTALMGLSLMWSSDAAQGAEKFSSFLVMAVPVFLFPAFVGTGSGQFDRFFKAVFFGILGMGSGLFVYSLLFFVDFREATLGLARNIVLLGIFFALGFFISAFYSMRPGPPAKRLFFGACAAFFLLLAVFSQSLGPILSLLAGSVLFAVFFAKRFGRAFLVFSALAAAFCVLAFFLFPQAFVFISPDFLSEDRGISARGALYSAAIGLTMKKPLLGWGLGAFSKEYGSTLPEYSLIVLGNRPVPYPHNIFLEASSELGAAGLALLAVFLVLAIYSFFLRLKPMAAGHERDFFILFFVAFAIGLVEAQFSFDFSGQRILWLSAGMLVFWPWRL